MKIIVKWLVSKNAIRENEAELYLYGLKNLVFLASPLLLAIFLGGFFGVIKESILVVLPFMPLRKFSGGYHAKYLKVCIIQSIISIGLSIWLATLVRKFILLHAGVCISIISLSLVSPIVSNNRVLDYDEKKRYKLIVVVMVLVYSIIYTIMFLMEFYNEAACLGVGIVLAACMQIPSILHKFKSY